jgi:hypothetical protein
MKGDIYMNADQKATQIINAIENLSDTVNLINSDKQQDIELFHDTQAVLQNLPFRHRVFIFNKYGMKLSYKDIQEKENQSFDTVHSLSKAWRRKTKQIVQQIFFATPKQYQIFAA